jgi:shikimate kinase
MQNKSSPARLLLIGYRGTGKTTVARLLAQRLDAQWVDTDVEVAKTAGRSIATLFAEAGEQAFRDQEAEVLRSLLSAPYRIFACGGGVVLREENRKLLAEAGTTILLQARPETIFTRLATDSNSKTQRPDLTSGGGLQEIIEVLAARQQLYQQCADIVVDTEKKTTERVADEILAACSSKQRTDP